MFRQMKRPMTTTEAMSRWLTALRCLELKAGLR